MTDSEFDIRRDEMERDNLQRAISEVETVLAVSTPGTRPLWENLLQNAKSRIGALEKKIKDAQEARETHEREQAAVAALAQKETALSSREKETYSGFLKEDFFTRKDFGKLEQFYEKTWDRLSQSGREEMSKRIWSGIRHGEYTFDQLPPAVREKEAKQAYRLLHEAGLKSERAEEVPEKDRQDFIRAYEAGKKDEAEKVLDRESFKRAMFQSSDSGARRHSAEGLGQEVKREVVAANSLNAGTNEELGKAPASAGKGDKDLASFGLDGVALIDVKTQGTSAEIPNARLAGTQGGRSTPGG